MRDDPSPLGKILIVDDDTKITELLKCNLSTEGYGVDIIDNACDVDICDIASHIMVIADAMNQDYTGIDLAYDIKENPSTAHLPVIICSSADGEDLVISAFDHGADDFIVKPFSLRELMARIKAVLRRQPHRTNTEAPRRSLHELSIEKLRLVIDTVGQKVVEDGLVVPLTKTEYAILLFLLKNQNSFFSRDEICNEVWRDEAGSNPRVVDTNISRLRKKLGEAGKHIINRYGMGYAFVEELA